MVCFFFLSVSGVARELTAETGETVFPWLQGLYWGRGEQSSVMCERTFFFFCFLFVFFLFSACSGAVEKIRPHSLSLFCRRTDRRSCGPRTPLERGEIRSSGKQWNFGPGRWTLPIRDPAVPIIAGRLHLANLLTNAKASEMAGFGGLAF